MYLAVEIIIWCMYFCLFCVMFSLTEPVQSTYSFQVNKLLANWILLREYSIFFVSMFHSISFSFSYNRNFPPYISNMSIPIFFLFVRNFNITSMLLLSIPFYTTRINWQYYRYVRCIYQKYEMCEQNSKIVYQNWKYEIQSNPSRYRIYSSFHMRYLARRIRVHIFFNMILETHIYCYAAHVSMTGFHQISSSISYNLF